RRLTEGCRRASGGCAAAPSTTRLRRAVPLPETSSGRMGVGWGYPTSASPDARLRRAPPPPTPPRRGGEFGTLLPLHHPRFRGDGPPPRGKLGEDAGRGWGRVEIN